MMPRLKWYFDLLTEHKNIKVGHPLAKLSESAHILQSTLFSLGKEMKEKFAVQIADRYFFLISTCIIDLHMCLNSMLKNISDLDL